MADNEITNEDVAGAATSVSWLLSFLRQPLSRVQTIVGIMAGVVSVTGAVAPLTGSVTIPANGEFVGVVEEARSRRPVLAAIVEISNGQGERVTTVMSTDDGRVRLSLREGRYRVRASHPRFTSEVRNVQVIGGQGSEVHLVLAPRPVPPSVETTVPAKPVERPKIVERASDAVREPAQNRPQTP